jgi:hypothetical protein
MNIVTIRKTAQCVESEVIFNNPKGKYSVKHKGDILYEKLRTSNVDKHDDIAVLKKSNTEKISQSVSVLQNINKEESRQIVPTNPSSVLVSHGLNNIQITNLTFFTKYKSCCICDFYIDKAMALTCQHILCEKCIKSYYEHRIESGYTSLTCPIYSCGAKVENETIKDYISDIHYDRLIYDTSILLLKGNQYSKSVLLQKHVDIFKTYLKKNVLDIADDESYVLFNKFKGDFCEKCSEPALYGRLSGNKMKCLNCFSKYCKFCFKNVTDDHFDRSATKYCKIFFRKKCIESPINERACWKNFGMAFLLIAFSYCLLVTGSFFHISQFINKYIRCTILYPIKLLIYGILFVIWLIVSFILIPFYPVLFSVIH